MVISQSSTSITLISVNVGHAEKLLDGKPTKTGINKRPTAAAITVGDLGLDGDAICNLKHHGGLDQAVYFYSQADYAWWENELSQPCPPGLFGENLLVSGPESAVVCIGDRFVCGELVLEVTSPRIPCNTLNRRMDDNTFGVRYRKADRPGWYCRVLHGGTVQRGMEFDWQPYAGERITMVEAMRDYYQRSLVPAKRAARYGSTPAHGRWQKQMDGVLGR